MRIIMTGGGTGGHIYPAIAIADEIKKKNKDAEILFVGAKGGLEKDLVPKNGYKIRLITVDGINRSNPIKNIRVMRHYMEGRKEAEVILKSFKPDVVVGTGGYASGPIVKTAQRMNIPTYVHEQNAIPGITNKMLERGVEKLFLGFGRSGQYFRFPKKHVVTGNPVRAEFNGKDAAPAREALGIEDGQFTVLAFGGSQGAGRLNKAMLEVVEAFNGADEFRIILATGRYYYDAILQELEGREIDLKDNISIMEYIHDMPEYLAAADLVVSRSGALTVAEVAVCGKPAIFIPSPVVTGNHQYYNALAVAEQGGAIIVEEKNLEQNRLMGEILRLKNHPDIMKDMAKKSAECGINDSAQIIYREIFGTAGK